MLKHAQSLKNLECSQRDLTWFALTLFTYEWSQYIHSICSSTKQQTWRWSQMIDHLQKSILIGSSHPRSVTAIRKNRATRSIIQRTGGHLLFQHQIGWEMVENVATTDEHIASVVVVDDHIRKIVVVRVAEGGQSVYPFGVVGPDWVWDWSPVGEGDQDEFLCLVHLG